MLLPAKREASVGHFPPCDCKLSLQTLLEKSACRLATEYSVLQAFHWVNCALLGAGCAVTCSKANGETGPYFIADKENCGLFLYKFTPAVLVCVLNNEGNPVTGHLRK